MGDLMHALPALSDACEQYPGIRFDWVVDEAFAEVPRWHPAVDHIYKSAHRRWKKNFWQSLTQGEFKAFRRGLNEKKYDVIIDAQNNVKSALISMLRQGNVHGMDSGSVAEQPAFLAYKYRHSIERQQHAISRQRELFARALNYPTPEAPINYGLRQDAFIKPAIDLPDNFVFLVHNASWTTKLWPEAHWHKLIEQLGDRKLDVVLPGGNQEELERAAKIAGAHNNAITIPRMSLSEIGGVISQAKGMVCCDTGLAHLGAMIGTPAVTLYGPTSHTLIGTSGQHQLQVHAQGKAFPCSPCYKRVCQFGEYRGNLMSACMQAFTPAQVLDALDSTLKQY